MTRGFPGKPNVPKMNLDQVTLEEALVINTINAAWSLRMEDSENLPTWSA